MRQALDILHREISQISSVSMSPADWAPTPKAELGDFAIPCFKIAKELKQNPAQTAQDLAQKLKAAISSSTELSLFSDFKAVGPYINVFQDMKQLLQLHLDALHNPSQKFATQNAGQGKRVVIDFSSPNVAKEIGLHHLRSTAIGQSLSKIYQYHGYDVVKINYLGDWGTSFGKLILGLQMFGNEDELAKQGLSYMLDLYVQFNQAEKSDPQLSTKAKEAFQKLESGDKEYQRIWKLYRDISLEQFATLYNRLGIEFDHYDGESLYIHDLEKHVENIDKKIGTQVSDGALICELPNHKIPVLLKKDDGASLYITRDLAAIYDRWERFHFDEILYVVAVQQKLHFQQLFDLAKALEAPFANKAEHISFGMLAFGSKTMKSREGNAIFLKDALDEGKTRALELIRAKNPDLPNAEAVADMVGQGALIFSDLSQNRNHTINFDWEQALSFEGDTAPFIQYTHARCSSVANRLQEHLQSLSESDMDQDLLEIAGLRQLVLSWDRYDIALEKALQQKDPSQIASATLDVARAFNSLYHQTRFLDLKDKSQASNILKVIQGTQKILSLGLSLLGIRAPDRM